MDFELSEEQRLLKDSVERLLADHYEFEARKTYMEAPEGFGRELWAKYAELGLLGLPFEERFGGFGGGPVETMIVAEAFGRALALDPFLATVVLGGGLLRHGGAPRRLPLRARRRQDAGAARGQRRQIPGQRARFRGSPRASGHRRVSGR